MDDAICQPDSCACALDKKSVTFSLCDRTARCNTEIQNVTQIYIYPNALYLRKCGIYHFVFAIYEETTNVNKMPLEVVNT
jgi:hypothetical protein